MEDGTVSREVSIRCTDQLWEKLIGDSRGESVSSAIRRKLEQSGTAPSTTPLWLVLVLLAGGVVLVVLINRQQFILIATFPSNC